MVFHLYFVVLHELVGVATRDSYGRRFMSLHF